MVVLAMVFALNVPAYATGQTGSANVKFVVPKSYSFSNSNPSINISGSIAQPRNYSTNATINYYYYTSNNMTITLGTTTMYDLVLAVATARGELTTTPPEFVSGYDSDPWAGDPGWYITTLSGLGTDAKAYNYSNIVGQSYWAGLSWMAYEVPDTVANSTNFNPLNISSTYLCSGYTSNTYAQDSYTYFMVYEPSLQIW
jgi:hypothetical protein